ncbi:MAG: alpha-amylase family glycosyl hydrolase [Kiritimatiellae bacterium]|nr:alpha-amylase family glycosyl hydrolase [Kiritimatiellia bacterium]
MLRTICYGILLCYPLMAWAADISWTPERPTLDDRITIRLTDVQQPAKLHWGVNAKGPAWKQPIFPYRPIASRPDGVAIQTPFRLPGRDGVAEIIIGPFNHPTQIVNTVDFAILFKDNTWESNEGKDYHIPITQARIETTPENPGPNDPITVQVRRSKPGGLLRWGVNIRRNAWTPPARIYWPPGSFPTPDGVAIDTPLPPPDKHGISTLMLGPFDHGAQVVTSLQMAAHWAGEWDTDGGRNYETRITLTPSNKTPAIEFVAPDNGDLFFSDFNALLNSADPLQLWMDGKPIASLTEEPFRHTVVVSNLTFGLHRLSASSGDTGHRALAAVDFWHAPFFRTSDYPEEAPLGATESTNGVVTFALHAPGKHFVSLIGDFNGWDPAADPMNYSTNGVWWLTRTLTPGSRRYQYLIDGTQRLADPFSVDVEWKDAKGIETYRPELAESVLEIGTKPFSWEKAASYQRPALSNLIIYECSIPDVSRGGFTGLIERLDYIRDLGVTAIEPLPWNEFTGAESWGYNPAFHFAPETAYGTPSELKTLICEAHQRGLAVIMDVVLNHMDGQSPLFQLYGDDYDASPWFYHFTGENWGFPDFDQKSPAFKRYVDEMVRYWSREYRVDGFRYDATRWVGWKGYNEYGASWFAWCGRQADPASFQIAEHLPSDPNLVNQTEMDSGWSAEFRWRICDMLKEGRFDTNEMQRLLQPERAGFSNIFQNVVYTESHDEERTFAEFSKVYSPEEATRRAIAALVLTLTAPGIPMLYAGQEWGEDTPKTVGPNPLHWERLNEPLSQTIYRATRGLCRLRTHNAALSGDQLELLQANGEEGVLVFRRTAGTQEVLVAVNAGRKPAEVELPLSPGAWRTVPGTGIRRIGDAVSLIHALPPGGSLVMEKNQTD